MYDIAKKFIQHISMRQMQIFEAVVRLGSYTRAAEELHLTQPTVSMQVKKLCDTIGFPLLEKKGNQLQTTAIGSEVYTCASNVLNNMVNLGNKTQFLNTTVQGPLRIAVITTAKYFMPHLLGAFINKYPQVHPTLKVTNRSRVLERLKSATDDLLIMGQVPVGHDVVAHPFVNNELVVVANPDHPLTKCQNITLEQLHHERFLMRESGSGTRLAIERLFLAKDLPIQPYMELGSSEAIKQAVMAGLGISVLSKHNLRLELAGNHIAILDVVGFPLFYRWNAVYLKAKRLSVTAQTFLDFLLANENKSVCES